MKAKKVPLRKCVGCNEQFEKRKLIRVVKTKENELFLDFTGKANGRGAYLCNDIACLDKAEKKDSLSRAFQTKVPREIYEQLRKEFQDEHKKD